MQNIPPPDLQNWLLLPCYCGLQLVSALAMRAFEVFFLLSFYRCIFLGGNHGVLGRIWGICIAGERRDV